MILWTLSIVSLIISVFRIIITKAKNNCKKDSVIAVDVKNSLISKLSIMCQTDNNTMSGAATIAMAMPNERLICWNLSEIGESLLKFAVSKVFKIRIYGWNARRTCILFRSLSMMRKGKSILRNVQIQFGCLLCSPYIKICKPKLITSAIRRTKITSLVEWSQEQRIIRATRHFDVHDDHSYNIHHYNHITKPCLSTKIWSLCKCLFIFISVDIMTMDVSHN